MPVADNGIKSSQFDIRGRKKIQLFKTFLMSSDLGPVRDDGVAVSLTYLPLDINSVISDVKSPKAGAIVLFAGLFLQC